MASVRERPSKSGKSTWSVLYRENGKQASTTFGTEKTAKKFASYVDLHGPAKARALWELEATSSAPTLDEWAARHLKSLAGVTDGTRRNYERMYARSWSVDLGRFPVDAISREQVQNVLRTYSERWSDKTVRNYHGVLAAMLEQAVIAGLIPASPCRGIRLPRRTEHEEREMRVLTHHEYDRLLAAMPAHYRPLTTTLFGTGMRWGEAEALTVGDIDLNAGTMRIVKAAKWNGASATRAIGPTKTKRSKRTISIRGPVSDALLPLLDRPRGATLFLDGAGEVMRNRRFWAIWRNACKKASLDEPHPRIHDARHTHASWLLAAGVGMHVIQLRLGHESITTTIDRYSHWMPDAQLAVDEVMAVALSGPNQPLGIEP